MKKQTLIFIPIPAAGHHASMVEMATRLHQFNPNFSATILLIPFHDFPLPSSSSNPNYLSFHELPHIEPPQPNPNETPATFFSLLVQLHKPHIKEAISALSGDVLIIDFFATTLIDVACELGNIPTYIYFTSNAAMLALMLHLPTLDEEIHQDFEELDEVLIQVPGLPLNIPPRSLPVSIASKKKQSYAWYLYHSRRFLEAKGIIINTFLDLEHTTLRSLSNRITNIYSIGPILSTRRREDSRHECLKWLDEQPVKSVVFLCFGSRGRFGEEQVREMAEGIERSGKKFLWVMKGLGGILPEGFEERNREKGVVWKESDHVPQMEVLSHGAVGGFVSHCGWNSVMESLWFGVPMMTWPLDAEQHMNAWLMVKEWEVGVELRVERGGGVVKKEEIENGVKCLMEEMRVRVRVMEMMSACRRAISDGGSSFLSFEKLVEDMLLLVKPRAEGEE